MRILLCFLLITGVCAADAVSEFRKAMSGNNAYDKRDAIADLASSSADDDVVLPLLIDALSDRQGSRYAVPALRRRTGLSPASGKAGSTGYPGYPASDSASNWKQWLQQREAALEAEAALEEAVATAEAAKEQADTATEIAVGGDVETADNPEQENTDESNDNTNAEEAVSAGPREKLDRIFFTDGSILRCYIVLQRVDLAGNLTSVRILHKDGGGEEIIDAAIIARIEEDYK